ncbi:MAG: sulfotransferase [Thermoguttaceae bacterium]|nr:sulfotransferase [Thermoguttaceae bacterium]MDO4857687.1 sulfotransferase [Thermoguttaceae bacterium]
MAENLPGNVKVVEAGGQKDKMMDPRMWNGMRFTPFVKLLARNGFLINPIRWPMAAINLFAGCVCSTLTISQRLQLGSAVEKTEIEKDPVFIVGHWRSGTTMLHEILMRDPQFTCPDTFSCFAPDFFLTSRKLITSILRLPEKRPMDNMAFGWDTPQEDEFALLAMGLPSPYVHLAFPNNMKWKGRQERILDCLDLNLSEKELEQWKKGLIWFIKALTYRDGRQLVMKSPTHTARVGVLREMFPNAKFIHISRSPYTLYASTVNLWKRFLSRDAFQFSNGAYLEELVFQSLVRMYEAYFRDTKDMPAENLIEIRYEDLCADKVGTMEKVYAQLNLGDFEKMRPGLERYAEEHKNYKKNKFEIDDELRARISERWKLYIDRFGE